jgi:ABC-2 type transport system ATP-binding protein
METIQLARPTLDDVFLTLTGRSLREDSGDQGAEQEPAMAEAGA